MDCYLHVAADRALPCLICELGAGALPLSVCCGASAFMANPAPLKLPGLPQHHKALMPLSLYTSFVLPLARQVGAGHDAIDLPDVRRRSHPFAYRDSNRLKASIRIHNHSSACSMAPQPVWLVNGASRGIGQEHARQALQAGHTVLAACRTPAKATELQQLAKEHPGQLHLLTLDVTDEKSIEVKHLHSVGCACKWRIQDPPYAPPDAA